MERQTAAWMKREDERIMEFMDSRGISSPDLISKEAFRKISPGHVRERLSFLEYAGFAYCVGLDSWELTTMGQAYLEGRIDATHHPIPTVDRVLRG